MRVPAEQLELIQAWSIDAYPAEACGLLLGNAQGLRRASLARNRAEGRRFDLHPQDLLDALHEAEAEGWQVLGSWHSHPDAPAVPSQADLAGAWPGWSLLIQSVR